MKEASYAEMTAKQIRKVTDDFHGFYQQYAGIVYRIALMVKGNPADAE